MAWAWAQPTGCGLQAHALFNPLPWFTTEHCYCTALPGSLQGALRFVRDVLWREVDIVSLPGERSEAAVELRPYPVKDKDERRAARAAGYEPPSFHQACRFFWHLNGTQAACMHGARCRFAHAAPREEFL